MLSRYKNWVMWQIKGRGYLLKKLKRSMTKVRTITPKALTRNSQNYQTSLKLEIIKKHKYINEKPFKIKISSVAIANEKQQIVHIEYIDLLKQ